MRGLSFEVFKFFLKGLEVLFIQIFHMLIYSYTKIFYTVYANCEGCGFLTFFLSTFIICIMEGYLFELILSSATLVKFFISCRSSIVALLASCMYTSYHWLWEILKINDCDFLFFGLRWHYVCGILFFYILHWMVLCVNLAEGGDITKKDASLEKIPPWDPAVRYFLN